MVGLGGDFPSKTAHSYSAELPIILPPTSLTATLATGPEVDLAWVDNTTNETGFIVERADNGGAFNLINSPAANSTTFADTSVALGNTYIYRVAAVTPDGTSPYSNEVTIVVDVPAAPTNLQTIALPTGTGLEMMIVGWADNANNETGFTMEWATDAAFTANFGTQDVPANTILSLCSEPGYQYMVFPCPGIQPGWCLQLGNFKSDLTGSRGVEWRSSAIGTGKQL